LAALIRSNCDERCAELARLTGAAVVDGDLNQGKTVGPIQNKIQYERVGGFLRMREPTARWYLTVRRWRARIFHRAHDRARHRR